LMLMGVRLVCVGAGGCVGDLDADGREVGLCGCRWVCRKH
jgi:hypothetical protein